MPLYEYECGSGHKFETVKSIANRYHALCPYCGSPGKIQISAWGRVIFAAFDTVVGHDGKVISRKQSTEEIPMLPEKVHGSRW